MNNEIKTSLVDCNETVEEYIRNTDWRIKANANSTFSASSMIANISGKVIANYWLDSVYSKEAGEAHRNGDIYIHDIDFPGPYCFHEDTTLITKEYGDISFRDLVERGVKSVTVKSVLDDGSVSWVEAVLPRVTRDNAPLIELEFEDGSKVKCTPDHKFMLTDGTWKEAQHLTQEDDIKTV